MFIPGSVISLITFPGVIVHEIGHRFFADQARVPVYDVCYYRFGNPAGYVIHGPVKGVKNALLIAIGPLIVNTTLCSVITFTVIPSIFTLAETPNPWPFFLLLWVGISIGMHAFPSNEDMQNLVQAVKEEKKGGLLVFAAHLFAGIFWFANILRFFWFDAIYALCISFLLPFAFGLL